VFGEAEPASLTHAMYLSSPHVLKLLFHGFVVVVGVLILSGAENTSIVGANGVLNRLAEGGVLTDWFRKPQKIRLDVGYATALDTQRDSAVGFCVISQDVKGS
jgi:hypothetical protein